MKKLLILSMLGFALAAAPSAHAQRISIGVGIGAAPAYVGPAPVCAYGYYSYYPYACAPYGFYGPQWFAGGVFIGAGPWFHGFYRPGYVGSGFYPHPVYRAAPFVRGPAHFAASPVRGGFSGGYAREGFAARGGFRGGRR